MRLTVSRESSLHRFFLNLWYQKTEKRHFVAYLLLPLTWLFRSIAVIRRWQTSKQAQLLTVPVVVIGNITVGGAGKTPVVIALAKALNAKGFKVGVISRGYGSQHDGADPPNRSLLVTAVTPVKQSGDEALLIAQETLSPVVINRDRVSAANYLLKEFPEVQVILSDDGLQHYRLHRSMEIVVVDGQRGIGNGLCLPAGPLREPVKRLKSVDWVLINGQQQSTVAKQLHEALADIIPSEKTAPITLKPEKWLQIKTQQIFALQPFPWSLLPENQESTQSERHKKIRNITSVAAIGHPQRFFQTIKSLGISTETLAFDDHHAYKMEDFHNIQDEIILMTVKDAVKCTAFANDQWWALKVAVNLPEALVNDVIDTIQST